MRIIRVFPDRTSFTPDDDFVFIGMPPMVIPEHDEIHISCIFTWDKAYARELAFQWEARTDKPVRLGGPAFGSIATDFQQGVYIKSNVIFTSRGCNNNCPWCIVPKIEGKLRELTVPVGNIIQDNNFLQTSRAHKEAVFEMLQSQKQICFKGGLECELVDEHFVNLLKGCTYQHGKRQVSRIAELWLACDTDAELPKFKCACKMLTDAGFTREKIKCYALIGDDMEKNEARLRQIYEAGAMPFAQLYREFTEIKTVYSQEWNAFARQWQRPACIKAHVEKGTNFADFHT